jgi:cytochrome c2
MAMDRWPSVRAVQADTAFRAEFVAKYVKPDGKDPKDKALAEAAEKARCNICHEGLNKKNRNAYGKSLGELLSRKTDTENKEKIRAALDTVAKKQIDPKDPASPTFGDLIRAGKLPGGDPKARDSKAK